MNYKIPFNKPFITGNEIKYIEDAVALGQISGNGQYTHRCQSFFESKFGFKKCLLTTSCTDALEMSAILLGIEDGDEVIIPSFAYVSVANAFVLRGAKPIFCDSTKSSPNIDHEKIAELITEKTKAIVVIHYAGISCDMDAVMRIADQHGLFVIEDAAHSIDSYYKGKPLGSIGHLATFSFHETKNIIAGEGGMLVVNDDRFLERAEIIWEKGTNRSAFNKGEVESYSWVDIGSSYTPSELVSAFLYAQLENIERIQDKRITLWNSYSFGLQQLEKESKIQLPKLADYSSNNGHIFYIICSSKLERSELIQHLAEDGVLAVFHYLPLHQSEFYKTHHSSKSDSSLEFSCFFSDHLLRLPLYFEMSQHEVSLVVKSIVRYYSE
ncbi:MAG: dTDP-4-amino-4,6-dideoxygalactose transaminase [Arenicella sp.]|jgi:dTDP-4-amino-4,6-dideoxygalactose transaminase